MGTRTTPSPASSRLDEILAHTRAVIAERKAAAQHSDPLLSRLTRSAHAHTPRGFVRALRAAAQRPAPCLPATIAELKRASPSKGILRESLDVPALARSLQSAGAAALSVLTEEKFFHGSLANLDAASRASTLPCLRKDFMLDEFQLIEARAHRADAILLLAAALDDKALQSLADKAIALDLDALCEVHTAPELDRVLSLSLDPARVALGINSRDLHSFSVSLDSTISLAARVPASSGFLLVAESGIATAADIRRLRDAGFSAFLIGETLMRAPDPAAALEELLAACG
jgi:indole-3-glycerol phosphate synthase